MVFAYSPLKKNNQKNPQNKLCCLSKAMISCLFWPITALAFDVENKISRTFLDEGAAMEALIKGVCVMTILIQIVSLVGTDASSRCDSCGGWCSGGLWHYCARNGCGCGLCRHWELRCHCGFSCSSRGPCWHCGWHCG